MISIVGLMIFAQRAERNCELYIPAKIAMGTANISAYKVPFNEPTISGIIESFGSKDDSPPVDCQVYLGSDWPSYQILPKNAFQPASGWGSSR